MTPSEASRFKLEIDIHFRLAVKADLPKMEWFGQYTHFRRLYRRAFSEQEAGRRLLLVADFNNFPIGHIFVQLSSMETAVADGSARAYFYSLRVMEMFRGQGIGSGLIAEAEARIIERGFGWATIAVAKDNLKAQRLYLRLGYRIFREDDGRWSYLDHEGQTRTVHEPCWMLEKELSVQ